MSNVLLLIVSFYEEGGGGGGSTPVCFLPIFLRAYFLQSLPKFVGTLAKVIF